MMNLKLIFVLLSIFLNAYLHAQESLNTKSRTIIIEGELPPDYEKRMLPNSAKINARMVELATVPFDHLSVYGERIIDTSIIMHNKVKWKIHADKPLLLFSPFLGYTTLINPGDSIQLNYKGNVPVYSGIGADGLKLQYEIQTIKSQKRPTKNALTINTQDDYFQWMKHLDKQLELIIPLIESYKNKVSSSAYHYIKSTQVRLAEEARSLAFNGLYNYSTQSPNSGLTLLDLNVIWDSTQKNTYWGNWLRSLSDYNGNVFYFYDFNRQVIRRRFSFDFSKDSLKSKKLRVEAYYNHAKKAYKGLIRERLLQYIIAEELITEVGPLDDLTLVILKDYYTQPGFPAYKQWIKEYEKEALVLKNGKRAPDFALIDKNGKVFTKDNLNGKVALLDFWFTGCAGCAQMTPALREVEDAFKDNPNVVFVSISTDKSKDQWEKSVSQGKYTTGSALNIYTDGQGTNHPMIKRYKISGYPALLLLDANGKIIANPVPDPRNKEDRAELINLIKKESLEGVKKQHALENDGPYILHQKDSLTAYQISNNALNVDHYTTKTGVKIKVQTDEKGKTFEVTLKSTLKAEPPEYEQPARLFAISDIEGNFEAFRNLLQANGIIDDKFNWTFGNGHLVFAGDMFDRGLQVTECLWLIYSLEEKAQQSGGYVHFVLGNHEIMNLQGDHRYVHEKYFMSAKMIGKTLTQLYNEGSELGRWLRTKNIMEKIGNLLFVHGGISPEVNRMPLTIAAINNLARSYYSGHLDSTNQDLLILFNNQRIPGGRDRTSPFWFRGYYGDLDNIQQIPTIQQIDSTLQKFDVQVIVTGHTIVADTITAHYGGKVINIDTRHDTGKSEALLIVKNKYYRATTKRKEALVLKPFDHSLTGR